MCNSQTNNVLELLLMRINVSMNEFIIYEFIFVIKTPNNRAQMLANIIHQVKYIQQAYLQIYIATIKQDNISTKQ